MCGLSKEGKTGVVFGDQRKDISSGLEAEESPHLIYVKIAKPAAVKMHRNSVWEAKTRSQAEC